MVLSRALQSAGPGSGTAGDGGHTEAFISWHHRGLSLVLTGMAASAEFPFSDGDHVVSFGRPAAVVMGRMYSCAGMVMEQLHGVVLTRMLSVASPFVVGRAGKGTPGTSIDRLGSPLRLYRAMLTPSTSRVSISVLDVGQMLLTVVPCVI